MESVHSCSPTKCKMSLIQFLRLAPPPLPDPVPFFCNRHRLLTQEWHERLNSLSTGLELPCYPDDEECVFFLFGAAVNRLGCFFFFFCPAANLLVVRERRFRLCFLFLFVPCVSSGVGRPSHTGAARDSVFFSSSARGVAPGGRVTDISASFFWPGRLELARGEVRSPARPVGLCPRGCVVVLT